MRRYTRQRRRALSLRMSAMGKKSQAIQRARRESSVTPEMLLDLAANPPLVRGDPLGAIQFANFRTGKIRRWTMLRGTRADNYQLRTPDGRTSRPHGLAWILNHLRPIILRS